MKKSGILNPAIARVLASTGHTDTIVVTDAGLPIPQNVERIDLAFVENVPRFLDVLKVVLSELTVEKIILAEEIKTASPAMYAEIMKLFPGLPVEVMPHVDFKRRTHECRAAIRSGEFTAYANVILVAGVAY